MFIGLSQPFMKLAPMYGSTVSAQQPFTNIPEDESKKLPGFVAIEITGNVYSLSVK